MAFGNLSAQIKFGSTIYALQLEEVVVSIRRSPYNQPMYGVSPVQKDMGYSDPSIRIRGVLPIANGSDGTNTIASKDTLENAVYTDFDENIDFILESGAGAVGSTSTYRCVISDFTATLVSTKEEIYWSFTMTLLSKFRDGVA
tara:strand:+ start:469 stop:897 length:429 start_codon:yes stop_codon:yes gene_type:complete